MTNDVKNVPEWRFAGFVDEWEKKLLNEIANVQMGQSPNSKNYTDDSQEMILVQGNADLKNGKVFPRIFTKEITKLANIGDILLSVRAPVGEIGISQMPVCIGRGVCSITSNLFIYYFLDYFNNENKWKKFSQGSTFESISGNEVRSLIIYSPSKTEQQKIGSFFSKLDRQIELEEQKLAKLEEQKKGYMQKIFSQELRFKDENGNDYPEWEDKLISDIGKVVTGNTPSKKDNDYWNSNQYVWVTPTDISNKKNIYTSDYQLSQKGFSKARQLPKNTLLITCIASIGKNAILRIEGSCNQQINAVIPNDNYDVDYLYYAFEDVSKLMKSIAGKTATQIVNKAAFEKLLLNVPIYEEQQKISGFLNKVDILIDKQTQKIDELKLRKQGFLQKMFV